MGTRRRVLELGPVAIEVPAIASVRLRGGGRFAAWSDEDLLTVSVGRYSVAVTERGVVVLRKYEAPRR